MPVHATKHTDGSRTITSFELVNEDGTLSARVMELGATLTHFVATTAAGAKTDIVLGFDDPFEYERVGRNQNPYFGCVVGRSCNRTALGKFALGGKQFELATNNGPNALHGGLEGFDKRVWAGEVVSQSPPTVVMRLESPDGDQGYPGTVDVAATFSLAGGDLAITLEATLRAGTAPQTLVNLTVHPYFNLDGVSTVHDHLVEMPGVAAFLELSPTQIPTGRVIESRQSHPATETLAAGALSFPAGAPKSIASSLAGVNEFRGIDHFFVRSPGAAALQRGTEPPADWAAAPLATVSSPHSGLALTLFSDAPGFQVYTANWLDGSLAAKTSTQPAGAVYGAYSAFCLEPSAPPDSINNSEWAHLVTLDAGKTWRQHLVFRVSRV
ncbi:hypothetical protein HK105_201546 [Polyrhizophydium stewartii]|uniref:Aldose 1-epimerase n=1 Tax=Polyrhizophydium stewartii TaxID=2732419 RepID=A0ABR4NGQ0_9FUNG|nr:hypothetical protein HK105_002030 [Polyrhizophydium stewartii]